MFRRRLAAPADPRARYSEDRVRSGAARLEKMLAAKQQGRLDGFFKKVDVPGAANGKNGKDDKKGGKRKVGPVGMRGVSAD